MADNNSAANLETNVANPRFPPLVVYTHVENSDTKQHDSDDSSDVKITPYYESIKTGESFVSPIYISEKTSTCSLGSEHFFLLQLLAKNKS